jgi:hypothetical protein
VSNSDQGVDGGGMRKKKVEARNAYKEISGGVLNHVPLCIAATTERLLNFV